MTCHSVLSGAAQCAHSERNESCLYHYNPLGLRQDNSLREFPRPSHFLESLHIVALQLHDIPDELAAEAVQVQAWTAAAQAIYSLAAQQQSVDPIHFDTLLTHLLEIDEALALTREKTRSRIPDLSHHERKIAHKVIFLIDDGPMRIRRV